MQDDFYKLVSILVNKCFQHLNLRQRTNLADLVTAFLSNTSFALWDIATSLSGNTSTKHTCAVTKCKQAQTIDLFFGQSDY